MEIEVGKQYLTRGKNIAKIKGQINGVYFGLVSISGLIYHCEWDAMGLAHGLAFGKDDLMEEIKTTDLQPNKNTNVDGSAFLTENDISELAQIGSQHLYLGEMDEVRLSYGGVLEIIKRYEEIRKNTTP